MSERYEGWDAHDLRDALLKTEARLADAMKMIASAEELMRLGAERRFFEEWQYLARLMLDAARATDRADEVQK